jgi:hypothetical protein
MGQLFDGGGKFPQGPTNVLGPCFQFIAARCDQVLVSSLVLKRPNSLLVEYQNLALQGSKKVCSFYAWGQV